MSLASWRRSVRPGRLRRWALAAAALALAASFLQPVLHLERARFEQVIVLDITQSMNVADQQQDGRPVSRLAFAKQALRQAVEALPCGSKVGWAIFTEYRSYLLIAPIEVCAHRAEWRATLAAIDNRMAWSGNSEIAKGLHSGLGIARLLPGKPSIVFVSDGHEAPPLAPRDRPRFDDDKPGEIKGLVVGVGALEPSPIPKTDPRGRPLGWWRADEVAQTDPRRDDGRASGDAAPGANPVPGNEQLSSLRETYLRLLASDKGLAYHRLRGAEGLAAALQTPELARPVLAPMDLRWGLALLALGALLSAAWPGSRH